MSEQQNVEGYLDLIDRAESYHDLVVLRARLFGILEGTLSQEDCRRVKDHWNSRAMDENLPVAPRSKLESGQA